MEETYARQADHIYPPACVAVIGVGGVGSWAALQLALAGVKKLVLVDPDHVEEHNRNRLPVPPEAVGKPKVEAVKAEILRLRPEAEVYALRVAVDENALRTLIRTYSPSIILDATDRMRVQEMIFKVCRESQAKYVRAGCDIASCGVWERVAGWGEAQDGYEVVPSWAATAAIAGGLATAQACEHPIRITLGTQLLKENRRRSVLRDVTA